MRHPNMQILAWSGIVHMHKADWGDEAGSTVTFRLPMQGKEDRRNPFESFTKRRKGRAGTRFFMAVTTSEPSPQAIYKDEVMLAGWNDSQQAGHTVKFWLCNDKMGHPFEGYSRKQELALALSELDDDNEPVDQKMREKVEKGSTKPSERLSYVAAMLCKSRDFWEWANQVQIIVGQAKVVDDFTATQFLRGSLGINSRAELDSEKQAAQLFHDTIRKPYLVWLAEKNDGAPF